MMWHARRENWSKQAEDARDDGDIDYARVIHSESFRRLQGKTQILNLGDSDFYRTRLTHSLEVAQIAGGVSGQLAKSFPESEVRPFLPGRAMVQALGCMHDLGHPPFGHGGEVALNYCMRDHGGFEGNGQTLRILSRLENFSENAGANLCRRSLLGVLKYPVPYARAYNPEIVPSLLTGTTRIQVLDSASCKPPKCYMDSEQDVVEWLLEDLPEDERAEFCASEARPGKHARSQHKSLDCSIMDVADDIAYGVHDLEDAIALQLIDRDTFANALRDKCPTFLDAMKAKYPAESENDVFDIVVEGLFGEGGARKRFIGRLVHHFITAVEYTEIPQFTDPLLRFRARLKAPQRAMLDVLQDLVVRRVIRSPTVQQLEFKGQGMVVAVFEALMAEPERLLSPDALTSFAASGDDPRIICDHIAAMTDTHLLRIYDRLFSPRMGSIFDRI